LRVATPILRHVQHQMMPASTKDGAAGKDLEAQCCWLPACSVLGRGDGPSRMGLANHRPQHGLIDYESAVGMLQAISTTRTVPLVRVPWTDGPGYRHESAGRGRLRCDLSHDQFCRGSANSLRLVATRPRAYEVVARLAQTSMAVRTTSPMQIERSSPWQ